MAELDEPGDEPNFDLFGSFGLDFFSDNKLLLTDLTEEKETTEQTEIGQLMMKTLTILLLKAETE